MKNKIPKFKSEAEERAFWVLHDSADFVDWKKGKKALFPNLRRGIRCRQTLDEKATRAP